MIFESIDCDGVTRRGFALGSWLHYDGQAFPLDPEHGQLELIQSYVESRGDWINAAYLGPWRFYAYENDQGKLCWEIMHLEEAWPDYQGSLESIINALTSGKLMRHGQANYGPKA